MHYDTGYSADSAKKGGERRSRRSRSRRDYAFAVGYGWEAFQEVEGMVGRAREGVEVRSLVRSDKISCHGAGVKYRVAT